MGLRGAGSYTPRSYLRGSYNKPMAGGYAPKTIQNQINTLKRQVGKNKPAKCYFRENYTATASAGIGGTTHSVTNDVISNANFRNNINGDVWTNHYLRLSGIVDNTNLTTRIIVYVPKKTGSSITSPTTAFGLVAIPDPAAWWVLDDFYVTQARDADDHGFNRFVSLKGLHTLYNTSATTLERGEIKIAVYYSVPNANTPYFMQAMLCCSDK